MYKAGLPRVVANHTADGNQTGNGLTDGLRNVPGELGHGIWEWAQGAAFRLAVTIALIFLVILIGRLAKRSLESSARRAAIRHELDDWKTRALVSRTKPLTIVIKLGLWAAAFIALLGVWGLRTGVLSLLTAAGFAGIIIGMAAANTLSNLIAGFIIFYNHPFDIGDWVEIDGVEGLVVDVLAGATILETWDGEKVTFPNRLVEGTKIRNMSHQRKLRRRFAVGVDYATDIHAIRPKLLALIRSHPEVLDDPEPMVIATGFGDSSINLEIRFWILPLRSQILMIQTWLIEEIQRLFAREGVVIPFPQRTLVYRYPEGTPPPGDTVSTLAYDAKADTRAFPSRPEQRPRDSNSPSRRQGQQPFRWFRPGNEKGDKSAP